MNWRGNVYQLGGERSQAGFSLLEIIVVTFIIGIMATLLVGALIQDNDRIAKLEAERFASVIIELQDEAVLAGTPYAVTLESNGYTTIAPFDPGSASESELLRRRSLQEGVRLKSDVAQPNQQDNSGDAFSWNQELEEDEEVQTAEGAFSLLQELSSMILVDTMGETSEFEARFIGDELVYVVFIGEKGQIMIEPEPR